MRKALAGLVAIVSALLVLPAAAGATGGGGPKTAQVYVTHGLPLAGPTPVDVYVNGGLAIDDFTFGKTVGPLPLAAATYDIEVRTPDGQGHHLRAGRGRARPRATSPSWPASSTPRARRA